MNDDYITICRPAHRSPGVEEENPLFGILLGEQKRVEKASEYDEKTWRVIGSRHTLICFDMGSFLVISAEACHHDDSILDELYAAFSILSPMEIKDKEKFLERCRFEAVKAFISEKFEEIIYFFEDDSPESNTAKCVLNSPPQVLAELIREAAKHEKHPLIIEAMDNKQISSVIRHAPDLKSLILPIVL